jgi:hypothetical protein
MSVQDETKARRIPGCWRGASEAHIRSDLQRASNEASSPEDKRISLILNANWNYSTANLRMATESGGSVMVSGVTRMPDSEAATNS